MMNLMNMFLTTLKVCLQVFFLRYNFILQRIYVRKEIKPFCKKSLFKKSLLKLTKECAFSVNNRPIKQINRCPMEVPSL